jgi:beta-glucosidase
MLRYEGGARHGKRQKKSTSCNNFLREKSRLGIPIIPFDEALHGLVRSGATAFPQAIGLAATWNTPLMHDVAGAIAVRSAARVASDRYCRPW